MLQNGDYITDGTATFIVIDVLDSTPCGSVVYDNYVRPRTVKCNGATVNRSDYPRLVAWADSNNQWTSDTTNEVGKIGVGDGSTTMVLPNLMGIFIEGADTGGGKVEAGLPDITGSYDTWGNRSSQYDLQGVFYGIRKDDYMPTIGEVAVKPSYSTVGFNASRSSAIYGNSTTVQPPAIKRIPLMYY